jgi:CrcB protein
MKLQLLRYFFVGAAGFVGTVLRFGISQWFGAFNIRFPLGTLFINVTGSFILGWFLTFVGMRGLSDTTRLAIGVGFVGGYTTFSTFMYESNRLIDDGAGLQATVNLIGSLVLGIVAVRLGILLARWT